MFGIFILIIAAIFVVGGLIIAVSPRMAVSTRAAGGGVLLLGIVMLVATSTVAVPARTVGVVTAFGKPTGTLSNGLHLIKPWEEVEKMDASLQTNRYTGDSAIGVRLANQSEAKADASIQWQLREEDAEQMYLDYREFERIHNDLVDREFRASVNAVLASYNPLDADAIAEGGIDLNEFADDIKKDMQKRMGKSVEVRSVALPIINYDEDTQRKIDQLQTEVANTRAAEQSKNTAKEIAEANEIMRKSLSDEVLSQRCIEAAEKVGAAPVGCVNGSGATPLVDMRKK